MNDPKLSPHLAGLSMLICGLPSGGGPLKIAPPMQRLREATASRWSDVSSGSCGRGAPSTSRVYFICNEQSCLLLFSLLFSFFFPFRPLGLFRCAFLAVGSLVSLRGGEEAV